MLARSLASGPRGFLSHFAFSIFILQFAFSEGSHFSYSFLMNPLLSSSVTKLGSVNSSGLCPQTSLRVIATYFEAYLHPRMIGIGRWNKHFEKDVVGLIHQFVVGSLKVFLITLMPKSRLVLNNAMPSRCAFM